MEGTWKIMRGAITAPRGYVWICNGKSRFGGEYQHKLVKEEELNKYIGGNDNER